MRIISTRLLAGLLDVLDQRGVPVAPIVEGLAYSETFLREGRERIDWETAATILVRTADALKGDSALRAAGREMIFTPSFERVAILLSRLADSWQLFRVIRLWLAPMLVPAVTRRYQETADGEITVLVSISAATPHIQLYFEMMIGVFEHAPTLVGSDDAEVEITVSGQDHILRIRPPVVDPERRLLLQNDPASEVANAALRELIDLQIDMQTTWETLRTAIAKLDERSQRLEALGRLSQALAEKLELSDLVRVILTMMVIDFDFVGGVLEIVPANGDVMRWGMGSRTEHSDITYPFAAP